jgi:hypothetical protein
MGVAATGKLFRNVGVVALEVLAKEEDSDAREAGVGVVVEMEDCRASEVEDCRVSEVEDGKASEVEDGKASEVEDGEASALEDNESTELDDDKSTIELEADSNVGVVTVAESVMEDSSSSATPTQHTVTCNFS